MNLVESLSPGYFQEFFSNAMFMYEGRVHKVVEVRSSGVSCIRLHDGQGVLVPNNFFLGFKVFNYPLLGYRRINDNVVSYLTRQQSVRRGLNESHIRKQLSPVSAKLVNLHLARDRGVRSLGVDVFEPQFDSRDDIRTMIAGERANVVLNEKVLIEPSITKAEDWYTIYHDQSIVGTMDYRQRTTFISDKYANIITPLLQGA